MALNMPTIIEYLGGGDAMIEMDTAREEVMTFLRILPAENNSMCM